MIRGVRLFFIEIPFDFERLLIMAQESHDLSHVFIYTAVLLNIYFFLQPFLV